MSRLANKRVAVTGQLASMSRQSVIQLIVNAGGSFVPRVDLHTSLVVIGAAGWPFERDGRLTKALLTARQLQRGGAQLEIEGETAFLRRVGCGEASPLLDRYTIPELTEMLGVSAARLRHWCSLDLIHPVAVDGPIRWFDFAEVRRCQLLLDMVSAGVPVKRLLRNLQYVRNWAPNATALLDRITLDGSRTLIRDRHDRWLEPQGQLLLSFGDDRSAESLAEGEILFQRAVDCESQGRAAEAARLYRQFLDSDNEDPDVWFNLANVLSELGASDEALPAYEEAVRLDPRFAEAWNNLGILLADMGRPTCGIEAFRQALEINPEYADAVYGLAATLDETGRHYEARRHWRHFLRCVSDGECAAHARAQLAPV